MEIEKPRIRATISFCMTTYRYLVLARDTEHVKSVHNDLTVRLDSDEWAALAYGAEGAVRKEICYWYLR
jgi:hypothetical protein